MHCYFVLAGDATIPVLYHVEHVREGKSFATRTVQARQRGKPIFTTTLSFMRENSGGKKTVNHAVPMPSGLTPPPDDDRSTPSEKDLMDGLSPFENHRLETLNAASSKPHEKITRQWIRARGQISAAGGHEAHLSAIAYMSDSHFIGTVSRIHNLWRYSRLPSPYPGAPETPQQMERRKLIADEGFGDDVDNVQGRPEIGMMVSLDHSIYFHEPRSFRADEWIFTEMDSPWAGDGRGVVTQRMWGKDGRLIATCFQEVSFYLFFFSFLLCAVFSFSLVVLYDRLV
jgi:acyl-CoA thioesterase 8